MDQLFKARCVAIAKQLLLWQKFWRRPLLQRMAGLLSPNATATEHGCCLPKRYEFAVCVRTPLLQSMAAVLLQLVNKTRAT